MNVYIYCADIYCEDCGNAIRNNLILECKEPEDVDNESSYDSNDYPKGPFGNGGGEADSPQHCGACNLFLENPLTNEGVEYINDVLSHPFKGPMEWREFYSAYLMGDSNAAHGL